MTTVWPRLVALVVLAAAGVPRALTEPRAPTTPPAAAAPASPAFYLEWAEYDKQLFGRVCEMDTGREVELLTINMNTLNTEDLVTTSFESRFDFRRRRRLHDLERNGLHFALYLHDSWTQTETRLDFPVHVPVWERDPRGRHAAPHPALTDSSSDLVSANLTEIENVTHSSSEDKCNTQPMWHTDVDDAVADDDPIVVCEPEDRNQVEHDHRYSVIEQSPPSSSNTILETRDEDLINTEHLSSSMMMMMTSSLKTIVTDHVSGQSSSSSHSERIGGSCTEAVLDNVSSERLGDESYCQESLLPVADKDGDIDHGDTIPVVDLDPISDTVLKDFISERFTRNHDSVPDRVDHSDTPSETPNQQYVSSIGDATDTDCDIDQQQMIAMKEKGDNSTSHVYMKSIITGTASTQIEDSAAVIPDRDHTLSHLSPSPVQQYLSSFGLVVTDQQLHDFADGLPTILQSRHIDDNRKLHDLVSRIWSLTSVNGNNRKKSNVSTKNLQSHVTAEVQKQLFELLFVSDLYEIVDVLNTLDSSLFEGNLFHLKLDHLCHSLMELAANRLRHVTHITDETLNSNRIGKRMKSIWRSVSESIPRIGNQLLKQLQKRFDSVPGPVRRQQQEVVSVSSPFAQPSEGDCEGIMEPVDTSLTADNISTSTSMVDITSSDIETVSAADIVPVPDAPVSEIVSTFKHVTDTGITDVVSALHNATSENIPQYHMNTDHTRMSAQCSDSTLSALLDSTPKARPSGKKKRRTRRESGASTKEAELDTGRHSDAQQPPQYSEAAPLTASNEAAPLLADSAPTASQAAPPLLTDLVKGCAERVNIADWPGCSPIHIEPLGDGAERQRLDDIVAIFSEDLNLSAVVSISRACDEVLRRFPQDAASESHLDHSNILSSSSQSLESLTLQLENDRPEAIAAIADLVSDHFQISVRTLIKQFQAWMSMCWPIVEYDLKPTLKVVIDKARAFVRYLRLELVSVVVHMTMEFYTSRVQVPRDELHDVHLALISAAIVDRLPALINDVLARLRPALQDALNQLFALIPFRQYPMLLIGLSALAHAGRGRPDDYFTDAELNELQPYVGPPGVLDSDQIETGVHGARRMALSAIRLVLEQAADLSSTRVDQDLLMLHGGILNESLRGAPPARVLSVVEAMLGRMRDHLLGKFESVVRCHFHEAESKIVTVIGHLVDACFYAGEGRRQLSELGVAEVLAVVQRTLDLYAAARDEMAEMFSGCLLGPVLRRAVSKAIYGHLRARCATRPAGATVAKLVDEFLVDLDRIIRDAIGTVVDSRRFRSVLVALLAELLPQRLLPAVCN